ncbi:hypothetical protein CR513_51934, partial [Mucuna pruriens]
MEPSPPLGKSNKLKKDIMNFSQFEQESLGKPERDSRKCFVDASTITSQRIFYNGLSTLNRTNIDATCGRMIT